MNIQQKQDMLSAALRRARAVTRVADDQRRAMTDAERAEVEADLTFASSMKAEIQASRLAGGGGGGGLLQAFKNAGWKPGTKTYIPNTGTKTASFDGDVDDLSPIRREGAALGYDQRFIHQAFNVVAVDQTTTSVQVLRQKERTLADPGPSSGGDSVIRPIDSTDVKAETDSVRELVTVSLSQVASIESGVPNIVFAQPGFASIVSSDMKLSILEGYDQLVLDAIDSCTPQTTTAGDDLFESIRNAVEDLASAGFTASTVFLSPADAVALDLFKSSGPEETYQFGAGNFARSPFGLTTRVGKNVTEPIVLAAGSFASFYATGLTLASFEEAAGQTNTQTVRLEGNAAVGIEREKAATIIEGGS